MNALVLALILAAGIERFVQVVVKPTMPQIAPYAGYVAILLGIAVAVVFDVDLFGALGVVAVYPLAGSIASGFVIGAGSNYVNDVISLVRGSSTPTIAK